MSWLAGSLSTMRFGDVDLPESLVSAHTDGRLVLFVGAGAVTDPVADLDNRHP